VPVADLSVDLMDAVLDVGDGEDEDDDDDEAVLEALVGGPSRLSALQQRISHAASEHVRVIITDNRHTLLSWKRPDESRELVVRAHHMFLDAPDDVAGAVGLWAVNRRTRLSDRLVDGFMSSHRHLVTRDRRPVGHPAGAVHDLQRVFDGLNSAEFGASVDAKIGWGEPGTPRRRRRRTIQLGCFDPENRTIVIHPALDQRFVPEFFVASVVFHEMLHEQIPVAHDGDRRCVHGPEFKRREDAFTLTPAAKRWQKANIGKLLSYKADNRKR